MKSKPVKMESGLNFGDLANAMCSGNGPAPLAPSTPYYATEERRAGEATPLLLPAWRIKKMTMNGTEWQNVVYTSEGVAKRLAQSKCEEFVECKALQVTVRMMNEEEGAVGNELVRVNRMTEDQYHCLSGLAKLTQAERAALKVYFQTQEA